MEFFIGFWLVIFIVGVIWWIVKTIAENNTTTNSEQRKRLDEPIINKDITSKSIPQTTRLYTTDPNFKYPDLRCVHPDIINLLYVVNNYPHSHLVIGSDPSTIYTMLPIAKDVSHTNITPLSYYPTYLGMSEEHKAIYFKFLSDPYIGGYDISYVFCLYYGLERQLYEGNLDAAFDVILKLKFTYEHKSFQRYSNIAVILTLMRKKRYDLLEEFIAYIREYNMLVLPVDVFLLALVAINGKFSASDLVCFKNEFNYKSNTYTKEKKHYFIEELKETMSYIFGSDEIPIGQLIDYREELSTFIQAVYSNRSLYQIVAEIPEFSKLEVFKNSCYDALMDAHERLKAKRIKV